MFAREIRIEGDVDADAIEAGFWDEVLTIRLPYTAQTGAGGRDAVSIEAG